VPCRDGKGKSLGVIHLRCPFDSEKWVQHQCGKRHRENMQRFLATEDLRKEGKLKSTKQTGIYAFFKSRTAVGEDENNDNDIGLPHSAVPSINCGGRTIAPAVNTDCCGIYNSLKGDYTKATPTSDGDAAALLCTLFS